MKLICIYILQNKKYHCFDFIFSKIRNNTSKEFWHLGCILYNKMDTLNIVFGFCVFNCIWEHMLKMMLYDFLKNVKYVPRSVNTFRTSYFLRCLGSLVLNDPLTSMKHPSEGRHVGVTVCSFDSDLCIRWPVF